MFLKQYQKNASNVVMWIRTMLKELSTSNIYIVCGHTDMRKSIDGLASIVQEQFELNIFSDSLFLFCGRNRNRLKVTVK